MKKALIAAMMFTPFFSNAASVGTILPLTKDIVFGTPNAFTHNLTPSANLLAGNVAMGTQVAAGEVKAASGSNQAQYAVQFSTGDVTGTFPGKTNTANRLALSISKDPGMTLATTVADVNNSGKWLVYPTSSDFKYVITTTTSGMVNADTYPITVNAAVYTP